MSEHPDPLRTAPEGDGRLVAPAPARAAFPPAQIGRYRVERLLGEGGFGRVYLARDEQLQRPVAVKVPHPHLIARPQDTDAYLAEARTAAGLDHPHIVPVFDVGGTPDFPCFIVSKFIEGRTLAWAIRHDRPAPAAAAALVASVADALQHAHQRGVVHRDVKPGNILLDAAGRPFVADFGLALREQDAGHGPRYAGTPAYMSPEQACGEGHRVDGRTDVFSLGVVFYELLTGRRPFHADSREELLEQIATHEPRPPRQWDDTIPKELERICLKALAKRAVDRYSTARDLADDLRHFLTSQPAATSPVAAVGVAGTPTGMPAPATPTATAPGASGELSASRTAPPSDGTALKVIPKGLRSFDAHDADFFLELLPGPRDREGLPDGIRFWKTRVEETDPDGAFAVGLIYGPSGCGKSSLVRAGLLPRLSDDVIAVYVEATARETEPRLLNGLRKRCPALPAQLGLKEALAALRRGQGVPAGKKVLIVLDQFEQWLHAKKEEQNTELVQALRQCDGGRVQCVVMVRDDFWMAATRFMRELEIRLVEAQNSAAVDLFDLDHARKVLAAFGRAFGKLPENSGETSKDQKTFLNEAVSGLAQEGKIVCVRLALFAEMMKGKAWTPTTLKEVGGAEGVGVTFLEETFSAATAPPEHRYHQKAARAVLKALLPESGADIKGHMRSHAELLQASGYANRPKDFDDLLRILDGEIRLLTPTDPEGQEEDAVSQVQMGQRYYQLTHDYLVPSLRDWLTRKQKETRRGRAELLLADRATVWNARPENRQLPSLWQWCSIRRLTQKKTWTPPQRKMMQKAGRYHTVRWLVAAACLIVLGFVGWEGYGRLTAHTLRDRLLEASTPDVPGIVKDMAPYRRWLDPLLHEAYAQAEKDNEPRKQLHTSLALLPVDSGQVEYLYGRLLQGQPQEVVVIREALSDHKQDRTERLWKLLENPRKDQDQRLRAACALAAFAPDDPRWEKVGDDVAAMLVIQKPFEIAQWADALKGVASDAYARLEKQLDEKSEPDASVDAKVALANKQAGIGTVLLAMGKGERVWRLLKHGPDPTLRSYLIERLGPGGVDPKILTARLEEEQEVSVKRAILLSLGEFGLDRLSLAERRNFLSRLLQLYGNDPDPGIHGAAEWLLRQWQASDEMKEIDKGLATGKVEGKRQWYVNRQGQTMVVVPKIGRSFAIASKEVTVDQFLRFRKDHEYNKDMAPTSDCPMIGVSWYDAAAYCNWLSEQEGIPKEEWCYLPNKAGKYADGMTTAPDCLRRTGYRLPTEGEWEYACRAGAETGFSFGEAEDLLGKYAWFSGNSLGTSHPVGSLKSNDLGLFDMHGNAWEWCQDAYRVGANGAGGDGKATDNIRDTNDAVLRGGSFFSQASSGRSAVRVNGGMPKYRVFNNGFRPARTFTP